MARAQHIGTALSSFAIAAAVTGWASPFSKSLNATGGFAGKTDSNIGLALRANNALQTGDFASAVDLAERAVEKSPADAGYRALLGNAYFGAGRFASAEAAYKDSLSLISNQPQVILKLALVSIAQGKNSEALTFLAAGEDVLDASDYGLAMALAGEPHQAIMILETAARNTAADGRVRQNLALAHAIAGNWEDARAIAAQDLPADLVDARIRQWMSFAKPARPADQVASLMQITPAASDPGQPVRLALHDQGSTRVAAVVPVTATPAQPAAEPVVQMAEAATPVMAVVDPAAIPAYVPPSAAVSAEPAPVADVSVEPAPAKKIAAPVRAASFVPKTPAKARATGKSSAVVQLGAYSSRDRVSVAWNQITKRYPGLREFTPVTARFDGPNGTVYRLSVKGFGNEREAIDRCRLLKSKGGSCFVRSVAGDAPVRMASR